MSMTDHQKIIMAKAAQAFAGETYNDIIYICSIVIAHSISKLPSEVHKHARTVINEYMDEMLKHE